MHACMHNPIDRQYYADGDQRREKRFVVRSSSIINAFRHALLHVLISLQQGDMCPTIASKIFRCREYPSHLMLVRSRAPVKGMNYWNNVSMAGHY